MRPARQIHRRIPLNKEEERVMSANWKSLHYETNRISEISDHGVDALATHKMDQLNMEAQTTCRICGENVKMIAAEKAATLCHCGRRKIYRWIEEGDLHFFETPDGEALVCGRSLSRKMDELDSTTDRLSERNASG